MQETFVEVNSVPTHVMTWGQKAGDKFENIKEMVLLIPGNPGACGFYTTFCSTIFNELENKIPVWVVGHAGHDNPKQELQMVIPQLEGNEQIYDLKGQLEHKVAFINEYIPSHVKIHILGHSIGAKLCIQLLKDEIVGHQIQKSYLLFPTIEKMVDSRNGYCFYRIFNRIFFILQFFYYAFSYLPLIARTWMLYAFCLIAGWPKEFLGTVLKFSSPEVIDRVWFMAVDEMENVVDIDEDIIKENMSRIKFYYGTTDGWVPTSYYNDLIVKFPGIDAELCSQKIAHGFVISSGPKMGRMVSDWIRRV